METILAKTGIFSPERAAQLDRVAASVAEKDRRLVAMRLRRDCNVFPRYLTADLDDIEFVRQTAPDALLAYSDVCVELRRIKDAPGTLVLRGDNGPGKTHLASALVNLFCDFGRSAYYCRAVDFFTQLKSTFGERGRTAEDLERRFRNYDLLVLDEIEIRSDSPWENNVLRSLIDARYASMKATILITNKSLEELQSYFSPAIMDRIRQEGGILNCDWRSLRERTV